jgi:hypothetical protein
VAEDALGPIERGFFMKGRMSAPVAVLAVTLGCAVRHDATSVWLTREGGTRSYNADRDFIRKSCELVRREEVVEPRDSSETLRKEARALGANAVLLETGAGGAPRNSFYNCQSMPSGVFDYDR